MSTSKSLRAALAAALILSAVATGVSPAVAQSEGGIVDQLVSDESEAGDAAVDVDVSAIVSNALVHAEAVTPVDIPAIAGDDSIDEAAIAQDIQATLKSNDKAVQQWVNKRVDASTKRDVVAIRVCDGSQAATVYAVADVTSKSEYANATVVDNTTRSVDHWVKLRRNAARDAPEVINKIITQYVQDGEDVPRGYVTGKLAQQYMGFVESSYFGDNGGKCGGDS